MEQCTICNQSKSGDVCNNCILNLEKCILCFQNFKIGDKVLQCKECLNLGHQDQFKGWLSIKKSCPICRIEYSNKLFQSLEIKEDTIEVCYLLRLDQYGQRSKIFDEFSFKLQFYDFQNSLIRSLTDGFLKHDRQLLISPPGSGKTIIGLAIARKLGKHTLILTPNLAVLGSWIDRTHMFFESDHSLKVHEVINKEKGELRPLTIITYQKFNTEIKKFLKEKKKKLSKINKLDNIKIDDTKNFIDRIIEFKIEFLILDEAHRLTGTWGENILSLMKELDNVKILGLTATPPEMEDDTFENLFNKNKTMIPLPQLVREKILSPYRDLMVTIQDPKVIKKQLQDKEDNDDEIVHEKLINLVEIQNKYSQSKITEINQLLQGTNSNKLAYTLMERGLNEYNYIQNMIKQYGVDGSDKKLQDAYWLCRNNSLRLLEMLNIIAHEYKVMGDQLRILVVTDNENISPKYTSKFKGIRGAIGIFETLVLDPVADLLQPIMVTGKSILVDDDFCDQFLLIGNKWARTMNYDIKMQAYKTKRKYDIINGSGSDWSTDIYTRFITYLFDNGVTKLLVGTRYLFGEGWDSINLNTIIDLTTISAYTTVNQIRGRALRQSLDKKNKTSHIWDFMPNKNFSGPFYDRELESLKKEYENYFGIDELGHIKNGINRMLPEDSLEYIQLLKNSFDISTNRDSTHSHWKVGELLGNLYTTITYTYTGEFIVLMQYEIAKCIVEAFREILQQFEIGGDIIVRSEIEDNKLLISAIIDNKFPILEIEELLNKNQNSGYLINFDFQPPSDYTYHNEWIPIKQRYIKNIFIPHPIKIEETEVVGEFTTFSAIRKLKQKNILIENVKPIIEFEYINESTIERLSGDFINSDTQYQIEFEKIVKDNVDKFMHNIEIVKSNHKRYIVLEFGFEIEKFDETYKFPISEIIFDFYMNYSITTNIHSEFCSINPKKPNTIFPFNSPKLIFKRITLYIPYSENKKIISNFYDDYNNSTQFYLIKKKFSFIEKVFIKLFKSELVDRSSFVISNPIPYDNIDNLTLIKEKNNFEIYCFENLNNETIHPIYIELKSLSIKNLDISKVNQN